MPDLNAHVDTAALHVAPRIQYAENQDGAVLIDEDQGLRFVFNPVGNFIWKGLRTRQSVPEITKLLAAECQVPEKEISEHITVFIAELKSNGLLLSTEELQARLQGNRLATKGRMNGLRRLVSLLKWS